MTTSREGGKESAFLTITANDKSKASPQCYVSRGGKVWGSMYPFIFVLGVGAALGVGRVLGVQFAHVLLVLRSTYRIGAPPAAD